MNSIVDKLKKSLSKLADGKKLQYVLIIVIALILIITLVFSFEENESNKISSDNSVLLYVNSLEEKLSDTLSKVEGVGNVSVIITVESGMETVLAMKTTTTQTSSGPVVEETPIIVNGKTVVLKETYPEIVGVMIVAKGANQISVLNKIQKATVSLLNIKLNQIEILTME